MIIPGDEKLTLRQVAAELGVHYRTVRKWIRANGLPVVRLSPHKYWIRRSRLEAWIESKES